MDSVFVVQILNLDDNSQETDSVYSGDDAGYSWAQKRKHELETELSGEFEIEVNSFRIANEVYA